MGRVLLVHNSIDKRRWLRVFILRFQQTALKLEDVVTQGVVLGLHELEVLFQSVEVADFGLKLLDVAFFALAECTL